jgi:hypothetical protein
MLTDKLREQIIDLRSRGFSYSAIAQQLDLPKANAVYWGHKLKKEIDLLRAVEIEAVQERLLGSYEERLKAAAARHRRLQEEVNDREAEGMELHELLKCLALARQDLDRLITPPVFAEAGDAAVEESQTPLAGKPLAAA